MSEQSGERSQDGFVRCGDTWVRASTITAVEVDYSPAAGSRGDYVVKVRSTALGMARVVGDHHPDKATAEAAAQALVAMLIGSSTQDQS